MLLGGDINMVYKFLGGTASNANGGGGVDDRDDDVFGGDGY